ncbi:hypothetical protein AB0A73_21590 [Glycomyces sp. NPDC047369]
MRRTYDFDLATGEFIPVFHPGGLRSDDLDWAAFAEATNRAVNAVVEQTRESLTAAIGPILATIASFAEYAERELARTIESMMPQLQAFSAVLLAAVEPSLAVLPSAPVPLDVSGASMTLEPETSVARVNWFGWLAHPYWAGIGALGGILVGLIGVLVAILLAL